MMYFWTIFLQHLVMRLCFCRTFQEIKLSHPIWEPCTFEKGEPADSVKYSYPVTAATF